MSLTTASGSWLDPDADLGYPVLHGAGRFAGLPALLPVHRGGLAVVSEEHVWQRWGQDLLAALAGLPDRVATYVFQPGEEQKSRETKAWLEDRLLADRWGRDLVILALGGGVVTDLAGFVAATYLRGVPWVALPTTLLGMVDAAIGGKTGVNTPAGKNLVGAFHRPLAVVADLRTLTTLPDEVLRAGLAEMVKHAALADRGLLDALAGSAPAFASRDLAIIEPLVARAAAIKAAVVARDEHEAGLRQVLNFGHTVGHALEAASGLALPHGQAVAIGMVVEARAACRAGRFPPGDLARLVDVLERLGLPTRAPGPLRLEALRSAFAVDKKNRGGEVRFSIPRALGDVGDGADGHAGSLDLDEVLRALGDPA